MEKSVQDLFSLDRQVALVTGASSGLGAHFARVLANAGASVIAAARRREKLDALVQEIVSDGGSAIAVDLDVTSSDSLEAAMNESEDKFGPIGILINNAGVMNSGHCLKVDEASWDATMETNLKGAWRVAHGVARRNAAQGISSSIINIASILGLRVGFGESTYAISKAAIVQMTKAMALELGRKNIRVNAIAPGYFSTEITAEVLRSEKGQELLAATPAGRMGEYHELTGPLLMLASEAGSFINGAVIPVDGGHLVSSL